FLIYLVHEQLDPMCFPLFDLYDLVEVRFRVAFSGLNVAFHDMVIRRVLILVERGRYLLHTEWREEAVIDALLERIGIDRAAKVGVRVHVVLAPGRRGEAELNGRSKIRENIAPGAFVVRSAAMTLVNNDKIEELGWVLAEVWRGLPVLHRTTHERLEYRKEEARILRDFALFADVLWLYSCQRGFREGRERRSIIKSLIREIVAVC